MKMRANDRNLPRGKTNWTEVDSLSEEEVTRRAKTDPDAQPLTSRELRAMRRMPDVKRIRLGLALSQEDFSRAYQIPLSTLRDWEQGRSEPDQSSKTLLQLIERIPEEVKTVLERCRAVSARA